MHFLWVIVIGFIAGIIARLLAPGPNNPAGFILTTVLGVAGAFIATFIGSGDRLVPARSGRGPDRRRCRRAHRLVRLAPTGGDARYPRPRRQTLALGWTVTRR